MKTNQNNTTKSVKYSVRLELLISVFLVAAILAIYIDTLNYDFILFDDPFYVYENQHVRQGLTLDGVIWAFTTTNTIVTNWHPITWLSHMLDCQIYGVDSGQHHFVNMLFHILNTLFLFGLFNKMTKNVWQSGFLAALFAIHPLHVESVAWVSERKDVLSTFFGMLTVWAYIRYTEYSSIKRYIPITIFFALSLMSKPMLVTLPFVLLLLDYWPLNRFRRLDPINSSRNLLVSKIIYEKAPLVALAVASSIITLFVQQNAMTEPIILPFLDRSANAIISYTTYIGRMIWPFQLSIIYPHPLKHALFYVAASTILLIILTGLVFRFRRRFPYLAVGWLWYLGTLVPVIGLVQVGLQSMADRYTYIPLIGLFIIVAWGGADILAGLRYSKTFRALISVLFLLFFGAIAWLQVQYWTNTITLFEHAINVTKNNYLAHSCLGSELSKKNRDDEAIRQFAKALQIHANYTPALNGLGAIRIYKGEIEEAIKIYEIISDIEPNNKQAHLILSKLLDLRTKRNIKDNLY